jgi:predicted RNase H-like nuclease
LSVAGIDRAGGGWAIAHLAGAEVDLEWVGHLSRAALAEAESVAIDIPLSLPVDRIGRACELSARSMLAGRASTIFPSLPAWCYQSDYTPAVLDRARAKFGSAYSKQSWNLGPAIFDAIDSARSGWFETHPELAFLSRLGRPLPSKKTWSGVRLRLDVIESCGVRIPPIGPDLATDDVLDAVMCAVVARDIVGGRARFVPDDPAEPRIWF